MVSGTESEELRDKARQAGAAALMHRSRVSDELVDAILELAGWEGDGARKN
jgi:hypothetical protein